MLVTQTELGFFALPTNGDETFPPTFWMCAIAQGATHLEKGKVGQRRREGNRKGKSQEGEIKKWGKNLQSCREEIRWVAQKGIRIKGGAEMIKKTKAGGKRSKRREDKMRCQVRQMTSGQIHRRKAQKKGVLSGLAPLSRLFALL